MMCTFIKKGLTAALVLGTLSLQTRDAFGACSSDEVRATFLNIATEEANTTTLRNEMRWTIHQTREPDLFNQMTEAVGNPTPRDAVAEGMQNVTTTDYYPVFNYIEKGKKKAAKIRVRRYMEKPEGTTNASAKYTKWPENLAKFEFKVDNPNFGFEDGVDNVIDKNGIVLVYDDIAKLMANQKSFLANVDRIKKDALKIVDPFTNKPNNPALVDEIFSRIEGLEGFLAARKEADLVPVLKVDYSRKSYRIFLVDPATKTKAEVQITLDRDIDIAILGPGGTQLKSFPKDMRVVEVKIPVPFANFNASFWKDSEQNKKIREVIAKLFEWQDPRFKQGGGKAANGQRL